MESVKELLEAEGTSAQEMEIHDSFNYDGGDAFYDLTIEKVYDDVVSVEQHYTQRMDRMSAPEIRFDVSDPENWIPVAYQNHDVIPQVYEEDETGLEMQDFIETWDKNLGSQFPAEEVTEAGGEK